MRIPHQSLIKNRLLRLLSSADFDLLAPHLEPITLSRGMVLMEPDHTFESAYFCDSGIGSIVTMSPEGQRVESGLFGRDGFSPATLALGGARSPYHTLTQGPGAGWRLPADALRDAMAASPALRSLLLRYAEALSIQTSYTALSNAVHSIDERLARWLLMCHDRVDGNEILLTHEFLSLMLAVRRPSVTTSLHVLEGNGFITAERGSVTIRDRRRLVEFAADAYGRPEAEYERLVGPLR